MYVGFNSNQFKDDKVFGGIVNFLMCSILISGSASTNWNMWYNDSKPYMSSIEVPYSTQNNYLRDPIVYTANFPTMAFQVMDGIEWTKSPYEEIEQYL